MRYTISHLVILALILFWPAQSWAQDEAAVALVEASRTGDLDGVKKALAGGLDINVKDGQKFTPLMHALDTGHSDIAQYLIGQGAKVDLMSNQYETPLMLAVQSTDSTTVKLLLEKGATWNEYTGIVMFNALVWSQADVLRVLDQYGANLSNQTRDGLNSLSVAAMFNNASAVKYLLEQGMDVNQPDPAGNYPLALAAFEGHHDTVKLLLVEGANPNAISRGSMNVRGNPPEAHTALVAAVRDNNLTVVNELLEAGANPNLLNVLALSYADITGNGAVYQRLLDAGAKPLPSYSFMAIETIQPEWMEDPEGAIRVDPVDWAALSIMNNPNRKNVDAQYTGPSVTLAVIPTHDDLADAEMLVTAELSGLNGINLLERAQWQKAIDEWSLAQSGMTAVDQSIRTGNLIGADALIILSQAGDAQEAKIVATSTGLVLRIIPSDKANPEQWAEQVKLAVLEKAPLLHDGADALTLVSIPLITSTRNEVADLDEGLALSQALGIYLGTIDGVYLLDRRNMLQLASEKMLTEDLRNFYSSGWLIDGSFDTADDRLEITVRLRQTQSGEEQIIRANGSIREANAVLASLSQQAAEILGVPKAPTQNLASEAELYLSEAQRAFKMQQWESAQHAADAVWVLGNHSDTALGLRVLSRLQRLRTQHKLLEQKIKKLRGPAQIMGYRAPHLVKSLDSRELTATQSINLADELLAIYQPIIRKTSDFTDAELDLLMLFPESLKGMLTPLESLHSISDEKAHATALRQLRKQILTTTQAILEIARKNDFPHVYQSVFHSYLQALPYLIRDEDALYTELQARLDEASAMSEPLSKHAAYQALDSIMRKSMNTVGGQAGTSWQRMARRMAKSDNPDAQLLGYDMVRDDAHDLQLRERLSIAMEPLARQLMQDDSLLGVIQYDTEIEEQLKLKGIFRKYPKYAMGHWLPNPYEFTYFMPEKSKGIYRRWWSPPTTNSSVADNQYLPDYQSQMVKFVLARLQSSSQNGSAAFPYGDLRRLLEQCDLATLEQMEALAEQAKAKVDQRVAGQAEWESTAKRYNSYVVRPIKEAAKAARDLTKSEGPEVFTLNAFQSPLLHPENPSEDDSNFRAAGLIVDETGFWIWDESSGLYHYNFAQSNLDQMIFLPDDSWAGECIEFFDERYFAVWFNGMKRERFFDIGVYDRKTKTWKYYNPDRVPEFQNSPSYVGVRSVAIIDDQLYYSYLMNPNTRGMNRSEFLKDAHTTGGLARIDLNTGEELLIASSNRTPAETPLDNQLDYYVYALESGELEVSKKLVYNPKTNEWRKKTRRDIRRDTQASFPRFKTDRYALKSISYDRETKTLSMTADDYYRKYPFVATRLHLQLDLSSFDNIKIPSENKQMQRDYENYKGHPRFNIQDHPIGLILYNDLGFYFIPTEDLKPHIEKTITYQDTSP